MNRLSMKYKATPLPATSTTAKTMPRVMNPAVLILVDVQEMITPSSITAL